MRIRRNIITIILCCILLAAVLLWPRESHLIQETRAAVEVAEDGERPVDFEALQKENRDIYAWLYIPGTSINEPLVQMEGDSNYYLNHNSSGKKDTAGALFTESAYNCRDFSDPAVVVYGKNSLENRLFGELQKTYSSPEGLENYSEVIIYLPEESLRFQVFAAAPFRGYHLLHYFKFSNEKRYQAFLQAIDSVKTIDANRNSEVAVSPGDPLLILSTTRQGDPSKCYLVLAKRILE